MYQPTYYLSLVCSKLKIDQTVTDIVLALLSLGFHLLCWVLSMVESSFEDTSRLVKVLQHSMEF